MAARRTKSLEEFLAVQHGDTSYLIEPQLLSQGGTMAVYGSAGRLKSWLLIEMAFALTTGTMWIGFQTRKSSVLLVQAEVVEAQYQKRLVKFSQNFNGAQPKELYIDNDLELKLDGFVGMNALVQDVKECRPDVIVMDCLYQLVEGTVTSEQGLKPFLKNLDSIKQHHGCAFCLVHHSRKAGEEDHGFDEMLNSSILRNWLDTIIKVTSVPPDAETVRVVDISFQKVKNAETELRPVRLRFNADKVRFGLA